MIGDQVFIGENGAVPGEPAYENFRNSFKGSVSSVSGFGVAVLAGLWLALIVIVLTFRTAAGGHKSMESP